MKPATVASREAWLAARLELLKQEKALSRARDDDGNIYHTYSLYARGLEKFITSYDLLDLVPNGRDEGGQNMNWVRRKDEYN